MDPLTTGEHVREKI